MNIKTDSSFIIGKSKIQPYTAQLDAKYLTGTALEQIRDWVNEKFKNLTVAPTVEHKCHNCGGTLEIENTKHIFICPYCKSVYAIGTEQINDRG